MAPFPVFISLSSLLVRNHGRFGIELTEGRGNSRWAPSLAYLSLMHGKLLERPCRQHHKGWTLPHSERPRGGPLQAKQHLAGWPLNTSGDTQRLTTALGKKLNVS